MKNGKKRLFHAAIATFLGVGYLPVAPATFASAIFCIIIWFLFRHPLIFGVVSILLFFVGLWVSSNLQSSWGEDSNRIVIDEVVGIIITLLFVPQSILFYAIGFLLFRFFDIIKPYPINIAQQLPRGWGVMMDDVVAGIYSNISLWIFIAIFYRIL